MVDCSNAHVYLNTYPLEQRTLVKKSTKELQRMTDFDSTDVFVSNLLDHYVQRPDKLENDCLQKKIRVNIIKQILLILQIMI